MPPLSRGADRRPVLGRRSVQSRSIPLLGIRESGGAHAHPFCYCCGLAGVAVNRSVANERKSGAYSLLTTLALSRHPASLKSIRQSSLVYKNLRTGSNSMRRAWISPCSQTEFPKTGFEKRLFKNTQPASPT